MSSKILLAPRLIYARLAWTHRWMNKCLHVTGARRLFDFKLPQLNYLAVEALEFPCVGCLETSRFGAFEFTPMSVRFRWARDVGRLIRTWIQDRACLDFLWRAQEQVHVVQLSTACWLWLEFSSGMAQTYIHPKQCHKATKQCQKATAWEG